MKLREIRANMSLEERASRDPTLIHPDAARAAMFALAILLILVLMLVWFIWTCKQKAAE
jgi:heme/copper-type cytochrome/quinol oxidase subunit 2